jgi:hypothetical protein
VPITFTLGGGPLVTPATSPATVLVPATATTGLPAATAAASDATGPPTLSALARVYTVKDAWREWQEGLAGQPALRELEARWGSC